MVSKLHYILPRGNVDLPVFLQAMPMGCGKTNLAVLVKSHAEGRVEMALINKLNQRCSSNPVKSTRCSSTLLSAGWKDAEMVAA